MNGNQQPNDSVYKPDQQPNCTALQALSKAFQELIKWALRDNMENSVTIVYSNWSIYKAVDRCYSEYRLRHLLGACGIIIKICDHEWALPIYQIEYHLGAK